MGMGLRTNDISWLVFFRAVKSTSITHPNACEIIAANEPLYSNQTENLTGDAPGVMVGVSHSKELSRMELGGEMESRVHSSGVEMLPDEEGQPNEST